MNCTLVIGWKPSPTGPQPECLYCGTSGSEAQAAALKAAQAGGFSAIKRMVNPLNWQPLPLTAVPVVASGAPKPIKREPTPPPSTKLQPTEVDKREAELVKLAKDRAARFNQPVVAPVPPAPTQPSVPPAPPVVVTSTPPAPSVPSTEKPTPQINETQV